MAIIRIRRGQPDLAVRIVQPGCDGGQLADDRNLRLVIRAPEFNCLKCSPMEFTGCWPGFDTPWHERPAPDEMPTLVYPAFDVNDRGEVVFRFDKQMWRLTPGRYWGIIELQNGLEVMRLDLDIDTLPFLLDGVSATA